MKVHPKEVMVNLPAVLLFDHEDKIPELASNFNTFLHGKTRMRYEVLGQLGGQSVGIFYLQRNDEFSELREQFTTLIVNELLANHNSPEPLVFNSSPIFGDDELPNICDEEAAIYSNEHALCLDCDSLSMLHQKGQDHCICGEDWNKGRCVDDWNDHCDKCGWHKNHCQC